VSLSFRHRRLALNKNIPHEVPGKSSLTISAKPDGLRAGNQPSTLTDKQSSLLTPIATNA